MRNILTILLIAYTFPVFAEFSVIVESGAAWQNRNDVRIPGETGTLVEFDEFNQGPFFHYRGEFFWKINKNHGLRMVYAPFNISVNGQTSTAVNFDNQIFNANTPLEINYQFNSYRLTYFYSFWDTGDKHLSLGFTGKIREAEIEFIQGGQTASFTNLGFVPLIYFSYQTPICDYLLFNFNMDALGASQGRAIDISMKVRSKLSENYQLGLGFRTLEGGADNDTVFTFSWFNYAVIDLVASF